MIKRVIDEVEKKASELDKNKMIPYKTIEEIINKHSVLEKDLASDKIDKKKFADKSKEYSDLNEIVEDAKKYLSFENDKNKIWKNFK